MEETGWKRGWEKTGGWKSYVGRTGERDRRAAGGPCQRLGMGEAPDGLWG